MEIRYSPNPTDYPKLSTAELRDAFLIESLFAPVKLELVYSDAYRAINPRRLVPTLVLTDGTAIGDAHP